MTLCFSDLVREIRILNPAARFMAYDTPVSIEPVIYGDILPKQLRLPEEYYFFEGLITNKNSNVPESLTNGFRYEMDHLRFIPSMY